MKFPFLFKSSESPSSSWPWPSCGNPKTLSFRAPGDILIKSSDLRCFPAVLEDPGGGGGESVEAVIRGLRSSERLFFEPGETNSILEEAKNDGFLLKRSLVMAMDSHDPYEDFKRSMEEMVEAYGLKDWECLEELLSCYLRVNGKSNYGHIVGAFVELLVGLAFNSSSLSLSSSSTSSEDHDQSSSSTTTTTTAGSRSPVSLLSFSSSTLSTSPCLSLLEAEDEIEKCVDVADV